jgi:pimeloyl-ACP methyl ester carboxylesterase
MSRTAIQATSAFYQASPALRLLRWTLAAAQRLWPSLAVRVAFRLFGTPLPPRWLRRPIRWDAHWRAERWPFEDGSLTLRTRTGPSDAPTVLLVHGWGGHAGQLLELAEAVTGQGLRPVLLELPAHGTNAGHVSNLPQFARAVDYAAARLQQDGHVLHALVAHSLGANAAAYAASRGLHVGRLVLLAPPASARDYTRFFAHVFGLSETTRARMQALIEAREGVLMANFEPQAMGGRIHVPTLVVHDRGDRINPFAHGEWFVREIAGARLLATEGLGHRKLLADPAVLQAVAAFLRTT